MDEPAGMRKLILLTELGISFSGVVIITFTIRPFNEKKLAIRYQPLHGAGTGYAPRLRSFSPPSVIR